MKNSLKFQISTLLIGVLIMAGCASTKKLADSYVGKWNYELETPQGNYNGNMQISQNGNEFTGSLNSDMGSVDLNDLKIENGQLTANFDMMGNTIDMKGSFEGDVFNGTMSAGGYDIPFKATRSKE